MTLLLPLIPDTNLFRRLTEVPNAKLYHDDEGRRYLEVNPEDDMIDNDREYMRGLSETTERDARVFYYRQPVKQKHPKTGASVSHPNRIDGPKILYREDEGGTLRLEVTYVLQPLKKRAHSLTGLLVGLCHTRPASFG